MIKVHDIDNNDNSKKNSDKNTNKNDLLILKNNNTIYYLYCVF